VGLDLARFQSDLAGHAYAARVHDDFMSGVRSGVNGTPTFYIDGVRYEGAYDADSLVQALQQASS
jgi:predicted DsbA family dithiol-disulfide isomerase